MLFLCVQAYLSAVIVYLHANDFQQASKCYNIDCSQHVIFLHIVFMCLELFLWVYPVFNHIRV